MPVADDESISTSLDESPDTTPTNDAEPKSNVADVDPSYTLLLAVTPEMVKLFAAIVTFVAEEETAL